MSNTYMCVSYWFRIFCIFHLHRTIECGFWTLLILSIICFILFFLNVIRDISWDTYKYTMYRTFNLIYPHGYNTKPLNPQNHQPHMKSIYWISMADIVTHNDCAICNLYVHSSMIVCAQSNWRHNILYQKNKMKNFQLN